MKQRKKSEDNISNWVPVGVDDADTFCQAGIDTEISMKWKLDI